MASVHSLSLSLSLTHTHTLSLSLSLSHSIDFIRIRLFLGKSNHSGMPPTPILLWRREEGGGSRILPIQ
jgi:hypothetical protein